MKLTSVVLAFVFFLSGVLTARGSNYYFSAVTGNDSRTPQQAQQQATPWKTLAKLNSYFSSLKPGDSVFLQCGSVFTGPLYVTQSGSAGHPIVFASYGTGAPPSISGFTTLTGWTSVGGGIWQSSCGGCGVRVNLVDVSDSSQPMGRYPNSNGPNGGYAIIQQHTDSTSITDPNLGKGPNWTGADVVIRKNRYVLERDSILLQSGNTITYATGSAIAAANNFGYFIENSLKALDVNGEWYYNPQTHMMDMYWTTNPSGISIQASMVDTLVNISKMQYISFKGILFQGSNSDGIYLFQAGNINFTNCSIRFSGLDGVQAIQSNYLTFQGVTIQYSNNNGMDLDGSYDQILNCQILRTATFPGTGNPTDSYLGININGNSNTVQYCTIDSTGFSPVEFVGASNAIRNNMIDYFAFVKDDGGGIYTWAGDIDSATRRVCGWITGNIVLNGITAAAGTDSSVAGIAHGIYLDENTQVADITGNTVANCTAGVFIQDSHELTVENNTFFNNSGQIIFRHNELGGTLKNNNISSNTAVSLSSSQYILVASSISPLAGPPAFTSFGSLESNKYAQISGNSLFYLLALEGLNSSGSFGLWKATYGMDWNSTELPLNFAPYTVNKLIGSNLYPNSEIITPFSTAVNDARVIVSTPIGAVDSGVAYVASFTMYAPDAAHTLLVYLQQYEPPYTHFTPVMNVVTGTPFTNNTVVFNSTTGSNPVSSLVFQMNLSNPLIYIDNISLYMADVTANNPANDYLFEYNASQSPVAIPLSGSYEDASGTAYQGTLTLQPYTSVVLFKK